MMRVALNMGCDESNCADAIYSRVALEGVGGADWFRIQTEESTHFNMVRILQITQ